MHALTRCLALLWVHVHYLSVRMFVKFLLQFYFIIGFSIIHNIIAETANYFIEKSLLFNVHCQNQHYRSGMFFLKAVSFQCSASIAPKFILNLTLCFFLFRHHDYSNLVKKTLSVLQVSKHSIVWHQQCHVNSFL